VEPTFSIIEKTMILVESPFFRGLTTEEAARIAARASESRFEEGEPVPYGEGFFYILEGAVDLELGNQVVHRVVPGDGFGMGSALGIQEVHELAGRAHPGTRCLFLPREEFLEVLLEHPEVAVALLKQLLIDNLDLHQQLIRATGGGPAGVYAQRPGPVKEET